MVTFLDFDEILIPLARRFHRTISNDERPGELNQYWSIGCGSNSHAGDRDFWPCISIKRGWRTATIQMNENNNSLERLEDIETAVSTIATGKFR